MPTFANGRQAMNALKIYLQTTLDTDYAADFVTETWRGVDVVAFTDEETTEQQVGRPLIQLRVQGDIRGTVADLEGKLRDCTVQATVKANDFSGAQTGAANPEGSDIKLSRALCEIIDEHYEQLSDLGLLCAECEAQGESVGDTSISHEIPHQITFRYWRP